MPKNTWDRRKNDFEEAAARVLRASRKSLTVQAITRIAIERGFISPVGKTPERSMYTIIRRANARRQRKGKPGRFVRHPAGRKVLYSLAE